MDNTGSEYVPSNDFMQHCFVLPYSGSTRDEKVAEFQGWLEQHRGNTDFNESDDNSVFTSTEDMKGTLFRRYTMLVPREYRYQREREFYRWLSSVTG